MSDQKVSYWQGRRIDQMQRDELAAALIESCQMYTELLEQNASRNREFTERLKAAPPAS